jgi:hypothetical protein
VRRPSPSAAGGLVLRRHIAASRFLEQASTVAKVDDLEGQVAAAAVSQDPVGGLVAEATLAGVEMTMPMRGLFMAMLLR